MAGLQRSATTFRRSGSSGLVWGERFFSGDLNQIKKKEAAAEAAQQFEELRHCKSMGSVAAAAGEMASDRRAGTYGGGRLGFRAGEVSPAAEPQSPKAAICFCCAVFGGGGSSSAAARRRKPRRR